MADQWTMTTWIFGASRGLRRGPFFRGTSIVSTTDLPFINGAKRLRVGKAATGKDLLFAWLVYLLGSLKARPEPRVDQGVTRAVFVLPRDDRQPLKSISI